MVNILELEDASRRTSSTETILLQEDHISTRFVARDLDPPILPGGVFQGVPWLRDFDSLVRMEQRRYLAERGLVLTVGIGGQFVNWRLIGAALERFDPQTSTFFFLCGEMGVLLEEVEGFFGLSRQAEGPARVVERRGRSWSALLRRITGSEEWAGWLVADQLCLRRLWEGVRGRIGQVDPHPTLVGSSFALGLLYVGTYLLPDGHWRMSRSAVALVEEQLLSGSGCLSQAVLAMLLRGIGEAARGEAFRGSPWMLSHWLERHFTFATVRTLRPATGGGARETSHSADRRREEFRRSFDRLTDDFVIFVPEGLTTVTVPVSGLSECILIGTDEFVAYPVHRLSRQLLSGYEVPPGLREVPPRVELRRFDEVDFRRVFDVCTHWAVHTRVAVLGAVPDFDDLGGRRTAYLAWVSARAPSDLSLGRDELWRRAGLGYLLETSTSQPLPLIESFEEFEGQRRRRRRR